MCKHPKKNLIQTVQKTIAKSLENKFMSQEQKQENLERQEPATSRVLELMQDYGDDGKGSRKIEFFFYTDSIEKAHQLANQLRVLDYELEVVNSANSKKLYLMNGWTNPIRIDNETMTSWSEHMSELGSSCDCEFDGWGTFMEL